MGNNRRSRHTGSYGGSPISSGHVGGGSGHGASTDHTPRNIHKRREPNSTEEIELYVALQEVDYGGKDILSLLSYLAVGSALVIVIGLAAGMTISVHYFEIDRPLPGTKMSLEDAEFLYTGPSCQHRVTSLDPSIAASNVVRKTRNKNDASLELGKVITTTESGQLHVLMVVEAEDDYAVPYHTDNTQSLFYNNVNNSTDGQGDNSPDDGRPSSSSSLSSPSSSVTFPQLSQPTILPSPCRSDRGRTVGFDSWERLSMAMSEANALSAERFMKWQQWFATHSFRAFDDDSMYYEEDVIFTICPHTKLRARGDAIFVNAENILLECDDCTISGGGTHLDFGGYAKNVLVRGITFERASTSSITVMNHGAEVTFEDCLWNDNAAVTEKLGAVADINSTSIVNFFRCEISMVNPDSNGSSASSLSIRAN